MLLILAETAVEVGNIASWTNLSATCIIGALLVWVITKAFPALLERHDTTLQHALNRHDTVLQAARDQFEGILKNIDTSRATSAREGHEAAKQLSVAIDRSSESVRENTIAVHGLTEKVTHIKSA